MNTQSAFFSHAGYLTSPELEARRRSLDDVESKDIVFVTPTMQGICDMIAKDVR